MSLQQSSVAFEASSSAERRSCVVFATMLGLVLLAAGFPEMAPQALLGILWTGAGVLLLLLPPEVRVPRLWLGLAVGFVGFSLAGYLPREWVTVSPWRLDVEARGLATGRYAFVQPRLAAEVLAGFAVSATVAVYLLGHRIGTRLHLRLALGFVLGVAVWTLAALHCHKPGDTFGFFPNRNHTATLLAIGTFTGLGCFAQAIRLKAPWKIALSVVPICFFLWVLFAVSESRAGIVLVAAGFVAWILLSGFRHLRGHTGKAIALLLLGIGGLFLIADSKVKTRLNETIERFDAPPPATVRPRISFDEGAVIQPELMMDGRITIFLDTWKMICGESWTGVGPGQFAQVFPQYREKTNASNDARCLHPESDWLMMLAETGWPAVLCLAAGVAALFLAALHQAWRGRARFLRMGCLVAALLLCWHGIFDVPGHRVGLLWAAILLAALSLRPPAENAAGNGKNEKNGRNGKNLALRSPAEQAAAHDTVPSRGSRLVWRGLGGLLMLAGIALLHAQWTNSPLLPSVQALRHMQQTKTLYDTDQAAYERATAEGRDYQPPPQQDPLETALKHVDQALRIAPLDPHLHYIRGALALHYDDKTAIASQAFAIQRRLAPTSVSLPMDQARAWMVQDPQQAAVLWGEALRRAAAEQTRFPQCPVGTVNIYQQVLQTVGKDETLSSAALELADKSSALQVLWARSVPAAMLDREMPRLLPALAASNDRNTLFRVWEERGSKGTAASFARAHPDLGLSPR
ncbi:MAG: O-antigen ligase family protein [Verrucomicrobia bacterium]|nr:O-antigen ligase family protein [Verrucomicrobiota bacterium]